LSSEPQTFSLLLFSVSLSFRHAVVPRTRISHSHLIPNIDEGTLSVEVMLSNLTSPTIRFSCQVKLQGILISSSTILPSMESSTANLTLSVQIPGSFPPTQSRASLFTKGEVLPPEVHRDAWMNGLALWSPEHPSLYDVTLSLVDEYGKNLDHVETYVGESRHGSRCTQIRYRSG